MTDDSANATREHHSRVRDLFERASAADTTSRSTILADARATHPEAAQEVEELLRFHDHGSRILDRPVAEAAAQVIGAAEAPQQIASYRITREIGAGGMGVVYEAEQDFPHRRAALKVVRPELVTQPLIRRFTHEAEALALLRHPGIAQLYEAGFADGERRRRPFIAMELVEGRPLSTYAREHDLTPRQRLELVALACDAVDHAHKRGVIHRDLKPGNILVNAEGQPKVLDFGIARLTAADGATISTSLGQIIGTLGYMSPEQFSPDPAAVDARSDVYALGVILYELLAGKPPIAIGTMTLAAAATAVQRTEPALLGSLSPLLKGDVEAIAAKALEKDPPRRYQSAAELAADIRRHLADEPVLAHPQTAWYQARKFARRNRTLVSLAAAALLALAAGVVGTTWQAVSATRARHRADIQAQTSRQRADFLAEVIRAATPEVAGGRDVTVREMLDKASENLEGKPDLDPLVLADTHQLLAEAYTSLGDPIKSEEHARGALAGHSAQPAPPAALIKDQRLLAMALSRRDRAPEAAAMLAELLPRARASLGPDDPEVLSILHTRGAVLSRIPGKADESEATYQEAWELATRLFGKDDPRALSASLGLAFAAMARDDNTRAETLSKEVMDARERLKGPEHADTLIAAHLWIATLHAQQKWEEYDRTAPILHERMTRVLGERHSVTIADAASLADRLRTRGLTAQALPIIRTVVEVNEQRMGQDAMFTVMHRYSLIQCLILEGLLPEARTVLDKQQDIVDRKFPRDGAMAAYTIAQQADLARREGDPARAQTWADRLKGTPHEELLNVPAGSTAGHNAAPAAHR
ncbi:MAG: serine/threonine-protein kinase [Phycisphaerales bacterium]